MPECHQVGKKTREILVSQESCPYLDEAGIQLAGISEARQGFSFVRHRPESGQILACLNGEGRVWLNQRWSKCTPGQLYLTSAHAFHAYQAVSGKPWRLAWVVFRDKADARLEPKLLVAAGEGLADTIKALHRECLGLRSPLLLRHLSDTLSFYHHRVVDPTTGDERLLRLWSRIDSVLHEPWDLDRLAASVHLSPEHLRRICQLHHGKSPMALLREMRLRRAATLLQRTMTPIEAIAAQVGYSDSFAFSKAFKRFFKINPSRQRRHFARATSSV